MLPVLVSTLSDIFFANIYYGGQGVKQDYKKAFEYYKLAAKQGHVKAKRALAKADYNEAMRRLHSG